MPTPARIKTPKKLKAGLEALAKSQAGLDPWY